ncbi:PPE family protein [Mycobacterium sp. UM_CSW]|uniref:PPE family protein n=1 Tax=Mycobacterium sp. UM_CSW TaxID=1370119 RepID=UPI00082F734A|nr:PPE family protein [Mycobacterium sp. UM_CSW]
MVLDFAALPPEINSGLMYTGAGAGPLMAASAAWSNLAAELSTTATSWESIIGTLTGEQWTGAGSAAAAAAAEPYISWLTTTAAAAEQAGAQSAASAAAYEAAFTATVPPPVIAANRAQLAALVATNFLGINTPAIMATEALYAEMWVQDAIAMYTYAAASTAAAALQPLAPAAPTASPAAAGIQSTAVSAAFANAAAAPAANGLGSILGQIFTPGEAIGTGFWNAAQAAGLGPLLTNLDGLLGTPALFNAVNGAVNTSAWFVMNTIPTAVSLGHTLAAAAPAATASDVVPLAGGAAIGEGTLVNSVGGGMSAGMAEASTVGGLSVPASWSSAAPATLASSTAPLEGSGWTAAADEPVAAMPGMPGMAGAAKAGAYGSGPRYGFKPIVMPKQVVV